MIIVVAWWAREDKDIIEIYHGKLPFYWSLDVIHRTLEGVWCVFYAEKHSYKSL